MLIILGIYIYELTRRYFKATICWDVMPRTLASVYHTTLYHKEKGRNLNIPRCANIKCVSLLVCFLLRFNFVCFVLVLL